MKKHFLLGLLLLLLLPLPVLAQGTPPIQAQVSLGMDGQCKFGAWLPVQVTLSNQGDDFTGELVIAYAQARQKFPLELPANAQKAFASVLYINQQNPSQQIDISLLTESGAEIALESLPLDCNATRLVGVLTDTPSAFTALNALPPANTTDVAYLDAASLSENWLGLQAMDILLVSNVDATKLTEKQHAALRTWIQKGGQIIFGGGAQYQKTWAGFDDILPLDVSGADTADVTLKLNPASEGLTLNNILLIQGDLAENATPLFSTGDQPLVVQKKLGAGLVMLLTFDPNISSFRSWDQIINFYDYLLIGISEKQDFSQVQNWDALINATSRFDGLTLPSTGLIFGLLIFYIILVGPVQYIVLRIMGRLELSWVTIPLITLVFTLALIFTGWDLRGTKPRVNQLAVVHHWAGTDEASLGGYASIFSPHRDRYEIDVDGNFIPMPFAPHYYYDTPNNEWDFTLHSDSFVAETDISNAEIMPIGLRGSIPAPAIKTDLALELNKNDALLTGSIQNQSEAALTDCSLLYPGGFKKLGRIGVGAERPIVEHIAYLAPSNFTSRASSGSSSSYYLDDLFQQPVYNDYQTSKKYNLLAAVFGDYEMPNVGFMLICWDETQVPYTLSLPGHETDTESLTLYLTSLDVPIETQDGQLSIPPLFFDWHIPEGNRFSYDSPDYLYFSYLDSAEIIYSLNTPVDYAQVDTLTLHLEGDSSERNDFPLDIFFWNFETEDWDQQAVRDWGDFTLENANPYVNGKGSEIRIMLNENGNGGGTFDVTRVVFSLVVAQ